MQLIPKPRLLAPAVIVALLAVGGCSGSGDEEGTDDVATLGASDDDSTNDESEDDEGGGGRGGEGVDPEFQDAVLEFAECMRDHGIDMPDPEITEDGGVLIGGGAMAQADEGEMPSEAEIEEMEAAQEECQPIMEDARGSLPEPDPEQLAEMQDQALEFAECMREHGIDFPDPVFDDEGGRMSVQIGGGPGEGGIDPDDEDFQEASEECGGEGGFGFGPATRAETSSSDEGDE